MPTYLEHLYNLEYPKNLISFYFLINNSTDQSLQILKNFSKQYINEYKNIEIDIYNDRNIPQDIGRITQIREKYIYKHLSNLRNKILQKCESDFLFSVDSDIFIKKDTLKRLILHNKDIVSCLIYNGYLVNKEQPYKFPNILEKENNMYKHIVNYWVKNPDKCEIGKLISVSATGACILIKKDICKNTKYFTHPQGEDIGWAESCIKKGYEMYCDVSCFAFHAMNEDYLNKYLNNEM